VHKNKERQLQIKNIHHKVVDIRVIIHNGVNIHMKKRGINLIKLVKVDIKEIKQNQSFMKINLEQKEKHYI